MCARVRAGVRVRAGLRVSVCVRVSVAYLQRGVFDSCVFCAFDVVDKFVEERFHSLMNYN